MISSRPANATEAVVVVDSSAILAVLNREAGADFIISRLRGSVLSAVNLQEVAKKMLEAGSTADAIHAAMDRLGVQILPHDADDAYRAASLAPATKKFGRGLGDRSCMALAIRLGVPAITTDRSWTQIDAPGLEVILAR
jgi:ribonuclease VapC